MNSIFRQSKISSRYFIDIVNQFRCNFISYLCLIILKTSIMSPHNLLCYVLACLLIQTVWFKLIYNSTLMCCMLVGHKHQGRHAWNSAAE